jgi:NAD(P)-dependent dehydrogenase (short-subunit alcohol dehydrogenase family)
VDDYDGKTALITGGASGVGLATARRLVAGGARVIITGRSPASLAAAAAELGGAAAAVRSDTAVLADIDDLAERIAGEFGPLNLLFANAGVTRFVAFEEMTEDIYDELAAINAKGPYFTVQRLLPLLPDGSSVVFTTSVADRKGLPLNSAYAAGKAALRSMTRSLARELQPRGIRVNAVSPGPIDTGILERTLGPEATTTRENMTANNPMHRFGDPDEVAQAVLFLAFNATFTTGAELAVDGGVSQL